jgi:CubicO group peptidase (beta-lactamase class C family)
MAVTVLALFSACGGPRFDYGRIGPHPSATLPASCTGLPDGTPDAVGIPRPTIDSIQRAAEALLTDELVIVRDGRVVHHWRHPSFRDTLWNPQSVTKAVASLGVGLLLDDGRVSSLDLPLRELFPEFAATDKAPVTLRMLMAHTSGIAAGRGEVQFAGQADVGAFVRSQPMAEPAGTVFRYSNVGAQLMGQVVEARSGMPLGRLLEERLFRPLCIGQWTWDVDARGSNYAYSRVHLRARDLAALGQLVLDGGEWQGQRLLSRAAIDTLTQMRGAGGLPLAPHSYAASWTRAGEDVVTLDRAWLARVQTTGASAPLLAALRRLMADSGSRTLPTPQFKMVLDTAIGTGAFASGLPRWYAETGGTVDPPRRRGPAQVVYHSGSWGQWLLLYPETRTVVVRYASWTHPGRRSEEDAASWNSMYADLYRLIGRKAP